MSEEQQYSDVAENQTMSINTHAIKRTIAGSVIGAAAGYVSSPDNRKKIKDFASIDQEEWKEKGRTIGKNAKTKASQAAGSLKQSAGKLLEQPVSKRSEESTHQQEQEMDALLDTLQEENDQLKNRLECIESKLTQLVEEDSADNHETEQGMKDSKQNSSTNKSSRKKKANYSIKSSDATLSSKSKPDKKETEVETKNSPKQKQSSNRKQSSSNDTAEENEG